MYALLIKPAAMQKSSHRKAIKQLVDAGAVILTSHKCEDLRSEVSSLINQHSGITVVACGGDGTVNLLLNAVIDLPVTFAVLPMGTGNDFARHINLKSLSKALQALMTGNTELVDVGQIYLSDSEVKYFLAIASCGFDAQVNERANKISGPSGTAKYLISVIGELRELAPLNLTLHDGQNEWNSDYSLIAIGNTSSYGGGMQITPSADMQDGTFTATLVQAVKRGTLLRVLPRVFTGTHVFHPKVEVAQFKQLAISGTDCAIYADGERMGIGPANFKVLPSHLQLVVPINA